MIDSFRFLSLCARVTDDDKTDRQLAKAAQTFSGWPELATLAESHGLGPLVYRRLKRAGVAIPSDTRRELAALTVRHRHAHQVRMEALNDILTVFEATGIRAIVLKGAALAHMIYPEPGLRPMRDLDLYVADGEVETALDVMSQLKGYAPELPKKPNDKHVMGNLHRDQLRVSVELHFHIPGTKGEEPIPLLMEPMLDFPVYILNREEMLRHLCQHTTGHSTVFEKFRLIWATDIVSFAEHFIDEIDWEKLHHERHPNPVGILSLLDGLIPLSERLINQAGIPINPRMGQIEKRDTAFHGWPRYSLAQQREKGAWGVLRDTLMPPEWWLRLHYSLSGTDALFWYRWVRHPLEVAGWVRQWAEEEINELGVAS